MIQHFRFCKRNVLSLSLACGIYSLGHAQEPLPGTSKTGAWTSGNKDFFGTAFESYDKDLSYSESSSTAPISKVWFTGASKIVSEIYWPLVDRAQVRESQFLVSDGKTFVFEEKGASDTSLEWIAPGVPAFKATTRDPQGRFVIEKLIFTDPSQNVFLQQVKFQSNVPGLHLYLFHNPAVGNTTGYDNARIEYGLKAEKFLQAWENSEAQVLISSNSFSSATVGFEGGLNGYKELKRDRKMSHFLDEVLHGNVEALLEIPLENDVGINQFELALGFANTLEKAEAIARESLDRSYLAIDEYKNQWLKYQGTVRDLSPFSGDSGILFRASVAILKSMEDKTFSGAFVASPSVPWGQHRFDSGSLSESARAGTTLQAATSFFNLASPSPRSGQTGGYHLIWPRDLYQMATTFLALGDSSSAIASLNYFKRIQYGPEHGTWNYGFRSRARDGSFLQNCWVNGEPFWTQLQMDQTALPIVLVNRLWKSQHIQLKDYWDLVRRAANFIEEFGPWSAQERWEENYGASPSTVAAQIAALWSAGKMASAMGEAESAKKYFARADSWSHKPSDNIDSWTFTSAGTRGNGKYFTRIEGAADYSQIWNPNDDASLWIGNGGGSHQEKDVLDGGFLELVRLGVRKALNTAILETLPEYDSFVKSETKQGPGFYRYTYDRYNYDDESGLQTAGMLWPLLSGERGHYEISAAAEKGLSLNEIRASARPFILAMESFATPSHMIPEQVWDKDARQGKPTGSATPLGWAHGEYIKLLQSAEVGFNGETIGSIADRSKMLDNKVWPRN